jgi:hypothetical protein
MTVYLTIEEQNHVLLSASQGLSVSAIAAAMCRHKRTIQRLLDKIHDRVGDDVTELPPTHVFQDRKFQKTMLKAIKSGREHAHIGVFVDTSPPDSRTRYYSPVSGSMCGSAAQMCADWAGGDLA